VLLHRLELNRLLSFGPDTEPVELGPLNVLIGPNGSGKSNFIEAIGLLQATRKELAEHFRKNGGGRAWIWKGEPDACARLEADLSVYGDTGDLMRHQLAFRASDQATWLEEERIVDVSPGEPEIVLFRYDENKLPVLGAEAKERALWRDRLTTQRSILSQVTDPVNYSDLWHLGNAYEQIRFYRYWTFGRDASPRRPQPADLPNAYLLEDASNLGLVLNKFRGHIPTKKALLEALRELFEGVTDFSVQVEGGTVQIFLEEEQWVIPATRLSDGTIRWLALLAVLLDPKPPPLVCIEEPELGLHPDLVNVLTRLLKSASERMQIIVTTHSEALVDAFRDTPEVVLVCERHEGSTTMRRLDPEQLAEWLKEYSLGQLWSKGVLGGNRW
jgi:predicted ATPase